MEKFKIERVNENTDTQECTLIVSGDLGISNIEKIKNSLSEAIKDFKLISIKAKDILFIDLSFLQLLISLVKDNNSGKEFSISISANQEFGKLILSTGFELEYDNKNK